MESSRSLYEKLLHSLTSTKSALISQLDQWEVEVGILRERHKSKIDFIDSRIREAEANLAAFPSAESLDVLSDRINEGLNSQPLEGHSSSPGAATNESNAFFSTSEAEIGAILNSAITKTEKARAVAYFIFERVARPMEPKALIKEASTRNLDIKESENMHELIRYALANTDLFVRPSRGKYWPKGWLLPDSEP